VKQIFIVGPTATGKSSLALDLARRCGGVICSVDAFQVYRQLSIGTGKATVAEQQMVPHHLIDLCGPLEKFSVADYLSAAARTLTAIPENQPQIWVGGTGLYVRALREGLTKAPESNPELVKELSASPLAALQDEIRRLDPAWCETADLQNPRRIIRALAVARETGKPLSAWQQDRSEALLPTARGAVILPERELNRALIARRVLQMWEAGWSDEVKALLAIDGWRESQSAKALGYLLIADYLEGKLGKRDCIGKIITLTGQYAKRQETWFKSEEKFEIIADREQAVRFLGQL
jgi:tRNA dimethylallyltransferase